MGSRHSSYTYSLPYTFAKRPLRRRVQIFLIEWFPVIACLTLALAILAMAYQLAA